MALPVGFTALPVGFAALPVGFTALPVGLVALPVGFAVLPVVIAALPVGFAALPHRRQWNSTDNREHSLNSVVTAARQLQSPPIKKNLVGMFPR